MSKKIDYTVSDKEEKEPVGYIKYYDSGEELMRYSEAEMLNDYKEDLDSYGPFTLDYFVYATEECPRNGLRYEFNKTKAGEPDEEYPKWEYEEDVLGIPYSKEYYFEGEDEFDKTQVPENAEISHGYDWSSDRWYTVTAVHKESSKTRDKSHEEREDSF